jgi:hypothetical protein
MFQFSLNQLNNKRFSSTFFTFLSYSGHWPCQKSIQSVTRDHKVWWGEGRETTERGWMIDCCSLWGLLFLGDGIGRGNRTLICPLAFGPKLFFSFWCVAWSHQFWLDCHQVWMHWVPKHSWQLCSLVPFQLLFW